LVPFVKIEPWEQGVRTTFGRNPKSVGPGIRWAVPVVHTVEVMNTRGQPLEVDVQTVGDVSVRVTLNYRVVDVPRLFAEVDEHEEYLANEVRSFVSEWLTTGQPARAALLRHYLERRLRSTARYGILVIDVALADYVPKARALRLLGSL